MKLQREVYANLFTQFLALVKIDVKDELPKENKSNESTHSTPSGGHRKLSLTSSHTDENMQKKANKKKQVTKEDIVKYGKPEMFHLFKAQGNPEDYLDKPYREQTNSSLLTVIGKANCLELVRHEYTQCYLNIWWKRYGRYLFYSSFFTYMCLLLSLTAFVATHDYSYDTNRTSTDHIRFHSTNAAVTNAFQVLLLVFAILSLVFEGLQIAAKGWFYWKLFENYADLTIVACSFILAIGSLITEYANWHHQLGTAIMTVAWINGAWLMTKVPSFAHPHLQEISMRFIMLFRVIRNVCIFLPVFSIFVLTFALAFQSLFQIKKPFNHLGYAMMKTMAMTIGELEFDDIFFNDDRSETPPFYTISCFIFVLFLGIMSISAMNLLIGMAVGDIRELRDRSEMIAFNIMVERIFETQALLNIFRARKAPRRQKRRKIPDLVGEQETGPIGDIETREDDDVQLADYDQELYKMLLGFYGRLLRERSQLDDSDDDDDEEHEVFAY